jgi:hypothetical protein
LFDSPSPQQQQRQNNKFTSSLLLQIHELFYLLQITLAEGEKKEKKDNPITCTTPNKK